jgi:hypothetical protein
MVGGEEDALDWAMDSPDEHTMIHGHELINLAKRVAA